VADARPAVQCRAGHGLDAVQRFETALLKAKRAMANHDFDEFFVTLDLMECLSTQGDAFDAICLVRGAPGARAAWLL